MKNIDKDERAIMTATKMSFSLTLGSKKDAKRVYKQLEKERLESTKSEDASNRKAAKDSKVILKGKKVIVKGGRWMAADFIMDFVL